jgi:hypothetical protein
MCPEARSVCVQRRLEFRDENGDLINTEVLKSDQPFHPAIMSSPNVVRGWPHPPLHYACDS